MLTCSELNSSLIYRFVPPIGYFCRTANPYLGKLRKVGRSFLIFQLDLRLSGVICVLAGAYSLRP